MQKGGTDQIEAKAYTPHNENQFRILDPCFIVSAEPLRHATNIRCKETNLSMDWRKMLTPRARRKTPLKKAPRSWARCQPKDNSGGESFLFDIWPAINKWSPRLLPAAYSKCDERHNETDKVVQLAK